MSKFDLKKKAIELRRKGFSYSEILKEIIVAKSTLSLWLKEVGLAKSQKQRITANRIAGQMRGAAARREQRLKLTQVIHKEALIDTNGLTLKELWYIGIALYWAEGAKQKSYHVSQRVSFSNSDPYMIAVFLKWLNECLKIPAERIYCDLYIHESHKHRLQEIVDFWSIKTGFASDHFQKIYFKKNVSKKTYRKNTGLLYNGLLRVNITSSTDLNRKITGWIQGIIKHCGIV
jgi:hypothetical protein